MGGAPVPIVLGVLVALAAGASLAALGERSSPPDEPERRGAARGTEPRSPCRHAQLALVARPRLDGVAVELSHRDGPACTLAAPLAVSLAIVAADGTPVKAVSGATDPFAGALYPRLTMLKTFVFVPRCRQHGPYRMTARASRYRATTVVPAPPACLRGGELVTR